MDSIPWNNPDADPIADLRSVEKMMIEACQMCGGTTWLYEYIEKHPYITVVKCKYCNGTGKLKEYQVNREPIPRHPVQSSQIASIGYEPNGSFLVVEFRDARGDPSDIYEYQGVPKWIYDDLIDPDYPMSKGRMFTRLVKGGGFHYRKLEKEE
jgi:hypothetical protein